MSKSTSSPYPSLSSGSLRGLETLLGLLSSKGGGGLDSAKGSAVSPVAIVDHAARFIVNR